MLRIRNIPLQLTRLLILLSFVIPRNISVVKLGIIVLSIFFYFFSGNTIRLKLKDTSTRFLLLYLVYSLGTSIHGFLRGNPDTYQLFRLNVIYFIMLYFFILSVKNMDDFMDVLRTCCWAVILISVYTLLFFAQTTGIIHLPFFIYLDDTSGAMVHSGYVHITNMNMSMMLFLFPVVLFCIGAEKIKKDPGFDRLVKIAVILSMIVMMLSGRRIIWIVLFGAIGLYIFFRTEKKKRRKLGKTLLIILAVVAVFYILSKRFGINIEGFVDRFLEAFRDRDNYGRENVRWEQLEALWRGFLKYPVFGSGAGVGVEDVVRGVGNTSSYELSYAVILYNAGIVGFLFYAWSLLTVLKKLYIFGKKDRISQALFFGLLFGLIANATNPYFSSSFDFLLWVFVPLMYLNAKERDTYEYIFELEGELLA